MPEAGDDIFSAEVRLRLENAGWYPGRRVPLSPDKQVFPAATRIYEEFGELRIAGGGRGVDLARSDVHIAVPRGSASFPELLDFERAIGARLAYIGDFQCLNHDMIIDDRGRIYTFDLDSDGLFMIADTFHKALEILLLGVRWYVKDDSSPRSGEHGR